MAWLSVALWMALIFTLSAQPGGAIPGRFSVAGHLVEYAVLGVLSYRAFSVRLGPVRAGVAAVLLASGYGVSDEVHQMFVPGRMPDVVDWAADTGGALAGVAAAWALRTRREDGAGAERQ